MQTFSTFSYPSQEAHTKEENWLLKATDFSFSVEFPHLILSGGGEKTDVQSKKKRNKTKLIDFFFMI